MFLQTILILLVMVIIFIVGSFYRKIPISLFLVLAAIVGYLMSGFGIPIDHLVEGTQVFLYLIWIVATGILFMATVKASGALDAMTTLIVVKFYKYPNLLLSLLMLLIMLPAMLTGSAPASVLSTGVLVAPILIRLGIPKVETAAILALGSLFGLVAPPINIPAMIIATGIYMPYEGFTLLLLILTVPLAIFSVLFLGRKYVGVVKLEEILEEIPESTAKRGGIIYLPLALVILTMIVIRMFPGVIPDIGTPLVFMIGSLISLFTGKKFNYFVVSKESMKGAIGVVSLFAGVGVLIEAMAQTGVRGLLVLTSLSLTGPLLYLAIVVSTILVSGPLMPFGVAAVLGIPFALILTGSNTIIITSALTLIMSLGCLVPPTAIGGIFAARVVGVERYSEVLKKCIIPSIVTIIVGLCTLIFSGWIDKILF